MKRNQFIRHLVPMAAAVAIAPRFAMGTPFIMTDLATLMTNEPPSLSTGDLVGITAPASPSNESDLFEAQIMLSHWGYEVCLGHTIGSHWQRFSGTELQRATDLQLMLNDPAIKAILFARGGYGVLRMIDLVDWTVLRKHPKWLIGYSDITALHCHISKNIGLPTLHADMGNGFKLLPDVSTSSLQLLLSGKRIDYLAPASTYNKPGHSTGALIGGNLSMVVSTLGSISEPDFKNKILFLEEVSEYKYAVDRMMITLQRSGKLAQLAGLVIGNFRLRPETDADYSMSVEEIILEKVRSYGYPVAFNFPAGHISDNMALKLGVPYKLTVQTDGSKLAQV